MNDAPQIHHSFTWILIAFGVFTLVGVSRTAAPYGRHQGESRWRTMPARLGWIVMESPAVFFYLWVFLQGEHRFERYLSKGDWKG